MQVIIAEKPSVAREIAAIVGGGGGLRLPGRKYKAASAAIRSGMAPACM